MSDQPHTGPTRADLAERLERAAVYFDGLAMTGSFGPDLREAAALARAASPPHTGERGFTREQLRQDTRIPAPPPHTGENECEGYCKRCGVRDPMDDNGTNCCEYGHDWVDGPPPHTGEARVERCPTCGGDEPEDRYVQIDEGRANDAGIPGCPDPFHEPASTTGEARSPVPNLDNLICHILDNTADKLDSEQWRDRLIYLAECVRFDGPGEPASTTGEARVDPDVEEALEILGWGPTPEPASTPEPPEDCDA